MQKSEGVLLTEGTISKKMVAFAVPIFLGMLFQQLYNTVDTFIVGNCLGSYALAAVSSSGNLSMLLVGFFNGLSMGAGVVVARCYGAKNYEELEKTVHTTVALGLIISVVLALLGRWLSPILLEMMGTPEEVLPMSNDYFAVYFTGIFGMVLYNMFAEILRAVGDSKHPLYFLIASSLTNVVLDLLFIEGFGWGVAGAAMATVISQALSAALSLWTLTHVKGVHRIVLTHVRINLHALWQIIRFGIPTGIQNSIISLANVVVQSQINAFGPAAMAGCGAYSKLEGFAFLPIMSFGSAMTTFIGQNLGAAKLERALRGARFGITCSVILAELIGVAFFFYGPFFVSLFDSNPEVIAFGTARAQCDALFYFLLAYSHAVAAVCRGGGKPMVPMVIMMVFWCAVRVGFLMLTARFHNILYVYWVYPLTWGLSSICFAIYYHSKTWLRAADTSRKAEPSNRFLESPETKAEPEADSADEKPALAFAREGGRECCCSGTCRKP